MFPGWRFDILLHLRYCNFVEYGYSSASNSVTAYKSFIAKHINTFAYSVPLKFNLLLISIFNLLSNL